MTASAATDAGVKLAANFDTFLKLLTTQLQYQDPLSPMDSNQFTQQLVQFSGVEQAIASNKNLEKLVNFQLSNATSTAASYIGKQVTAGGDTAQLTGGSARWSYTLGANAADTQIEISDLAGHVVYKTSGQTTMGEHIFAWDGRASDNSIVPDGTYKISIASASRRSRWERGAGRTGSRPWTAARTTSAIRACPSSFGWTPSAATSATARPRNRG